MRDIRVLHYLHEYHLGGGALLCRQLLTDMKSLGVPVAIAAHEDGVMRADFENAGIDTFLMPYAEKLESVARQWGATVIHGNTCGGGSAACSVAKTLGIVGGETLHSLVSRTGAMAGDFEIALCEALQRCRPGSTLIRLAYPPERFAVSVSREALRRQWGIPPRARVIGRNGRLDGSKAPDEFLRCLAFLPGVWGVMVGDGPMRRELEGLAAELGVSERLVMPGMQRDTGNWFNAMDVIVYPTRDELVCAGVIEPLFLAKPVVCYSVGAMDETIIHEETGLHASTPRGLAEAAARLLNDPLEAKRLGEAGRRHIFSKGHGDPLAQAAAHLDLYQRLGA